jgi:hypothetical protein
MEFQIGEKVECDMAGVVFKGEIVSYDEAKKLYKIKIDIGHLHAPGNLLKKVP